MKKRKATKKVPYNMRMDNIADHIFKAKCELESLINSNPHLKSKIKELERQREDEIEMMMEMNKLTCLMFNLK